MMRAFVFGLIVALGLPVPGLTDVFRPVTAKSEFVSLVSGRKLTRTGIQLDVSATGAIVGRGFGAAVSGKWVWMGEYFCRDLAWGQRELGYNCQRVEVRGNTLRFISDKGAGRHADLRLE